MTLTGQGFSDDVETTGPSPPISKWSGGGSHPVLKAREGESTRGGIPPLLIRGGGWGPPPRKFLNFERFYVRF